MSSGRGSPIGRTPASASGSHSESLRALAALGLTLGALAVLVPRAAGAAFPGAGLDSFESDMTVVATVGVLGQQTIELHGPVTVLRDDPSLDGGVEVVQTEIVAMNLTGSFMGLDVRLGLNPEVSSVGEVRAQSADNSFPADSFFDVFFELEIPTVGTLVNLEAVRIEAQNLNKLPPLFDTYMHPPPQIPLVVMGTTGPVVATVEGESSHKPVQDPMFSTTALSSLEPATLYGLPIPPPIVLSRAGLALVNGDDIDGVSTGRDGIDEPPYTTLAFSVDPASAGAPGTGVEQEALAGKAEGGEFVTFVDNTNRVMVPADAMVPVPGSDDVDALTDSPASQVDFDDDQVPDAPVFLSLAPGSATLTSLGASAADILVSASGAVSVFATAADIGLSTSDDIDAFCLMKSALPGTTLRAGPGPPAPPPPGPLTFDYMLFSLAPGSPTLAAQGHSAADVFVTDFSNSRPALGGQPLVVYAEASEIGLLGSDDLNALKCLLPAVMFEMDGLGDLDDPGNGTGCQDVEADTAILFDQGITNHSGDHLQPPAASPGLFGFFDFWSIQNPYAGDYHGPYAWPGSIGSLFMPSGDPATDVQFVGGPGDNCGLPHVHGGFFGIDLWDRFGFHQDPDTLACGHGVFIPSFFPIQVIPTRRSQVPVLAQSTVDLLNSLSNGLFSVSWHLYNGPTTLDISDCKDPNLKRAFLIITGLGVTQANFFFLGQYSGSNLGASASSALLSAPASTLAPTAMRIGPAQRSVDVPLLVPEPSGGLLGFTAIGVLGWLARRRRRT